MADIILKWLPVIISVLTLLGLGTVFKNFWSDKHANKKARSEAEIARVKKEKQEEMREVIVSELAPIKEEISKIGNQMELNTTGTITLLRDRMKCSLNYCLKQGWASTTDKANWLELYKSYKDLGGNHFREYVDQWKYEMENLPSEEEYKRKWSNL